MTITVNGPNGVVIRFPDGTDQATIDNAMRQAISGQEGMADRLGLADDARPQVGVFEDVAKSAVSGLATGTMAIPGLPGDVQGWARGIGDWVGNKLFGEDPAREARVAAAFPNILPTTGDISQTVSNATGFKPYEPQTTAGEYMRTAAEFAPGGAATGIARGLRAALAGGIKYGVIPGLASEGAGQATEGTAFEAPARVAAALAAGIAPAAFSRMANAGSATNAARIAAGGVTADNMTTASLRQALDDLGPDAMIADLGPNLSRQAGALASVPGRGQEIVRDALRQRSEGANARIRGDIDATIGPAPIPSRIDESLVANQRALDPAYIQVLAGARRVDTTAIANALDSAVVNLRGPAQRRVRDVREMLNVPGQNVLDPNPATLLQTRQAIDGLLTGETDGNVIRALTQARRMVDQELAGAAPGIKDVDAQFAELARQREALTRGQQVLESGRTAPRPAELADEVTQGSVPQGTMVGPSAVPVRLREGARAEIERIVGTNSNDVVALNRIIKGEGSWNRDRLATLFGQDRADRIIRVLDRERQFAQTAATVASNSETAARQAAQREIAPEISGRGDAGVVRSLFNLKFGDAAARVADTLTGRSASARQAARNEELARILTAPNVRGSIDPRIEALARALMTRHLQRLRPGLTAAGAGASIPYRRQSAETTGAGP